MLMAFTGDRDYEKVEKYVTEQMNVNGGVTMCTVAQSLINQGMQQGMQRGMQQGIIEGIAQIINGQMRRLNLSYDEVADMLELTNEQRNECRKYCMG